MLAIFASLTLPSTRQFIDLLCTAAPVAVLLLQWRLSLGCLQRGVWVPVYFGDNPKPVMRPTLATGECRAKTAWIVIGLAAGMTLLCVLLKGPDLCMPLVGVADVMAVFGYGMISACEPTEFNERGYMLTDEHVAGFGKTLAIKRLRSRFW